MKKIFIRFSSVIASVALMVTSFSVNSTCMFIMHQPEIPGQAVKLRKS